LGVRELNYFISPLSPAGKGNKLVLLEQNWRGGMYQWKQLETKKWQHLLFHGTSV